MRTLLASTFAFSLCFAGCGVMQPPSVHVDSVTLDRVDAEEAQATFALDVVNSNAVALDVARSHYALRIDGTQVADSGDAEIALHLPAAGGATVSLPIRVRFADLALGAVGALLSNEPGYALVLGLGFDTDVGPLDFEVEEQGSLPSIPSS
jgi:LEA14-like dessication related protein